MNDNTMNDRMKSVRMALKLSQAKFGERIGIAQTALSMIELGNNPITSKNVKLICIVFNVNEQWLRTGNGVMFSDSPYLKELCEILSDLEPETQKFLLIAAQELLKLQKKLLSKRDEDYMSSQVAEAPKKYNSTDSAE